VNEKQLQKAMELIAYAGDSRSQSVTAMTLAEEGKLSEARKKLEEAKKQFIRLMKFKPIGCRLK
jgi:PTS system cellobiose-specific IIA component